MRTWSWNAVVRYDSIGSFLVGSAMSHAGFADMMRSRHQSRSSSEMSMCSVAHTSKPIVSPCSFPKAMSSRHTRTSCSRERNTSGPMNPDTSLM